MVCLLSIEAARELDRAMEILHDDVAKDSGLAAEGGLDGKHMIETVVRHGKKGVPIKTVDISEGSMDARRLPMTFRLNCISQLVTTCNHVRRESL
jgi:hypothetical protein